MRRADPPDDAYNDDPERPTWRSTVLAVARQRIHLPPNAWLRAVGGLASGRLWDGDATARLERAFAEFVGVPEAVAVPSGRAGLRFIYEAMGLEQGADVIASAFAYPVVPHLTRSLGYDVRFVDCEMDTLGMDPDALAAAITDDTRVVIVTHLYGVPVRIREIVEIAEARGAVVIEDCAHCYGASVGERRVGSFGRFGYFSFETSKPINTLGGGMVTTNDAEAAARLREVARRESPHGFGWLARRLLKTTFEATVTNPLFFNLGVYPALRMAAGKDEKEDNRFASGYQRDEVTMQGRMGRFANYQGNLGLAQMRRALPLVERRVANAERLMGHLEGKVRFQRNDAPDVRSNYMLVTALFPNMKEMAHRLLRLGVDTKHRYMRDCSGLLDGEQVFPNAARAEREVLHLPAYPELSDARIDWIAERVDQAVEAAGA
jgi:dTDP-4-amino-4,6-dideoxygalactose transaminase